LRGPSALTLVGSLIAFGPAFAEDDGARRVRAEVDQELGTMVRIPPPQVEVVFSGIDASDYLLESASFTLDNQTLPASAAQLSPGKVVYSAQLPAGRHVFTSQLVYKEAPGTVFTYMSGTRFKVPGRVEFVAQRGLLVHIRAGVHADPGADLQARLKPANHVEPEMLAKLEDGYMPDAPRPRFAQLVPDAGEPAAVAVADATPPPTETANDAEPPPGRHRAHAGKRTTRKGTLVASAAHEERPAPAMAPAPPPVETQAPQALTGVDAGPIQLAMAEPVAALHPSAPATVAVETDTSGLPTWAKIGLVLGVMLVALVGLTLVLRRR
jgi:hypothetical protein